MYSGDLELIREACQILDIDKNILNINCLTVLRPSVIMEDRSSDGRLSAIKNVSSFYNEVSVIRDKFSLYAGPVSPSDDNLMPTQLSADDESRLNIGEEGYELCSDCGELVKETNFKEHKIRLHKDGNDNDYDEKVDCNVCGESLKKKNMKRHLIKHSTTPIVYECNNCKKSFLRKYDRDRHEAVHVEAVYDCESCKKCFNVKSNLTRHKKTCRAK